VTGSDPAAEPTWDEKILVLDRVLAEQGLQYAFGGAIALNYHREPRSTLDIDINIFVAPEEGEAVLGALARAFPLADRPALEAEIAREGQARARWGTTFVDLFLSSTAFHRSMVERIERQPFADRLIPVLSIEDLLVCKALFDRPKDWVDLEAVVATRGGELDREYIIRWLGHFLDGRDHRYRKAKAILSRLGNQDGRPTTG
jgi:hypothetical protein